MPRPTRSVAVPGSQPAKAGHAWRSQPSPLAEWREVDPIRGIPASGTIMAQRQSRRQGEEAWHAAVRLPAKADRRITTPREAMLSADQGGIETVLQYRRSAYSTRMAALFPATRPHRQARPPRPDSRGDAALVSPSWRSGISSSRIRVFRSPDPSTAVDVADRQRRTPRTILVRPPCGLLDGLIWPEGSRHRNRIGQLFPADARAQRKAAPWTSLHRETK